MDNYGVLVPSCGDRLIAKLLAGDQLRMTKVVVGSGRIPEGTDPHDRTDLFEPVALATSTPPVVTGNAVSMVLEYRSDLNGGLQEDFWLREFGVYAIDPVDGEVLLYYGNLGNKPQPVSAYVDGRIDVRRFPVKIIVHSGVEVKIDWVPGAWLTAEDIEAHNRDPHAHPDRNPTAHIATIKHQLEGVPLCTLYRTEDALGTLPFGEGPYGGGGRMDTPYRFRILPGRQIEVYATPEFTELGTPTVIWSGTHQCNLVFAGSRTNLIVEMRD